MFRKSIICRVGTWHTELELNKSPKHGLRLGKVVENEGSDMRGRGTKEPLRLLRLYSTLPSANIHERLMSPIACGEVGRDQHRFMAALVQDRQSRRRCELGMPQMKPNTGTGELRSKEIWPDLLCPTREIGDRNNADIVKMRFCYPSAV